MQNEELINQLQLLIENTQYLRQGSVLSFDNNQVQVRLNDFTTITTKNLGVTKLGNCLVVTAEGGVYAIQESRENNNGVVNIINRRVNRETTSQEKTKIKDFYIFLNVVETSNPYPSSCKSKFYKIPMKDDNLVQYKDYPPVEVDFICAEILSGYSRVQSGVKKDGNIFPTCNDCLKLPIGEDIPFPEIDVDDDNAIRADLEAYRNLKVYRYAMIPDFLTLEDYQIQMNSYVNNPDTTLYGSQENTVGYTVAEIDPRDYPTPFGCRSTKRSEPKMITGRLFESSEEHYIGFSSGYSTSISSSTRTFGNTTVEGAFSTTNVTYHPDFPDLLRTLTVFEPRLQSVAFPSNQTLYVTIFGNGWMFYDTLEKIDLFYSWWNTQADEPSFYITLESGQEIFVDIPFKLEPIPLPYLCENAPSNGGSGTEEPPLPPEIYDPETKTLAIPLSRYKGELHLCIAGKDILLHTDNVEAYFGTFIRNPSYNFGDSTENPSFHSPESTIYSYNYFEQIYSVSGLGIFKVSNYFDNLFSVPGQWQNTQLITSQGISGFDMPGRQHLLKNIKYFNITKDEFVVLIFLGNKRVNTLDTVYNEERVSTNFLDFYLNSNSESFADEWVWSYEKIKIVHIKKAQIVSQQIFEVNNLDENEVNRLISNDWKSSLFQLNKYFVNNLFVVLRQFAKTFPNYFEVRSPLPSFLIFLNKITGFDSFFPKTKEFDSLLFFKPPTPSFNTPPISSKYSETPYRLLGVYSPYHPFAKKSDEGDLKLFYTRNEFHSIPFLFFETSVNKILYNNPWQRPTSLFDYVTFLDIPPSLGAFEYILMYEGKMLQKPIGFQGMSEPHPTTGVQEPYSTLDYVNNVESFSENTNWHSGIFFPQLSEFSRLKNSTEYKEQKLLSYGNYPTQTICYYRTFPFINYINKKLFRLSSFTFTEILFSVKQERKRKLVYSSEELGNSEFLRGYYSGEVVGELYEEWWNQFIEETKKTVEVKVSSPKFNTYNTEDYQIDYWNNPEVVENFDIRNIKPVFTSITKDEKKYKHTIILPPELRDRIKQKNSFLIYLSFTEK